MSQDSEYMRVVKVYISVIGDLLGQASSCQADLCAWSKDNTLANFRAMDFKLALKQYEGLDNYRYYMRIFRNFNWIVCKAEKFTNVQWVKGKSVRVVSVDYKKYLLIKELIDKGIYIEIINKYIEVIEKNIYLDKNTDKRLYYWAKENKIMNVKSENFRRILKKDCKDERDATYYLRYFRKMEFIICKDGNFSNVQWLDGKSIRVMSIDFNKYKLIKELLTS